jgi:hypothetical protein
MVSIVPLVTTSVGPTLIAVVPAAANTGSALMAAARASITCHASWPGSVTTAN